MGKHQRRQTWATTVYSGASVRTQRVHAYVHLGGVPYAERATKREREVRGCCTRERRTQSSWGFYGGYTRRIHGRQAEAHQFPIQFAALALPILGDSTPAREHHPFRPRDGTAGSMNRFAIKYRGSHRPSFDRVCYGGKKRERGGRGGESCEKRQESSRFHIQETLYSAGISGNVLYIPG